MRNKVNWIRMSGLALVAGSLASGATCEDWNKMTGLAKLNYTEAYSAGLGAGVYIQISRDGKSGADADAEFEESKSAVLGHASVAQMAREISAVCQKEPKKEMPLALGEAFVNVITSAADKP
jgi:hypothetical protein